MKVRITAQAHVNNYLSKVGIEMGELEIAPIAILSWDVTMIKALAKVIGAKRSPYWLHSNHVYNGEVEGKQVTLVYLPIGSPIAVNTIEELIVCGVKVFIGLGYTGTLQPDVEIGSFFIPTSCLREEGTSPHYLADEAKIVPSPGLVKILQETCQENGEEWVSGKIWTTDAMYRELLSKIEDYGQQGVIGVDMETSAMYAVGKFKDVDICNLLLVSDKVWCEWQSGYGEDQLNDAMTRVQKVILKAIPKIDFDRS